MSDQRDATTRAMMPVLPPAPEGDEQSTRPVAAAGWSSWLDADDDSGTSTKRSGDVEDDETQAVSWDLHAEDPMAPLVEEARRRTLAMRRKQQLITRAALLAALVVAIAFVAVGAWVFSGNETPTATPPPAAPEPTPAAPAADASVNWCQESNTPERVVGAGSGDASTSAGVILRLEYAWYVLRDPVAVRAVIAPDARVAPESSTRDAISAVPIGTQHCVTVSPLPADRWLATVDERHPDGSRVSWQQVITTAQRDGRVLITAIVESGQ